MHYLYCRGAKLILPALFLALLLHDCMGVNKVTVPGKIDAGTVLLPNGWKLSPAGIQIEAGDLPLNLDISPDGHYVIVTNNGEGDQEVTIIDLQKQHVTQRVPVSGSWLGIRFFEEGRKFFLSGGNGNRIYIYAFNEGIATLTDSLVIGRPWPTEKIWVGGLDVDDSLGLLCATARENNRCYIIDIKSKKILHVVALPSKPYTCLLSRVSASIYVSLWGSASVLDLDKNSGKIKRAIQVGDHPTDMAESPDGMRLYVANSNLNTVSVVSTASGSVMETINSALFPEMTEGSTPNSVALSPDGKRLFIANADNNFISVVDVSNPGNSRPIGFIPTGWYPTCVRYRNSDPGEIIVANGKGNTSKANPKGPNPYQRNEQEEYIGTILKGTVSLIQDPSPTELAAYSETVYLNTLKRKGQSINPGEPNPVLAGKDRECPIKHVFYIIKENRTYDQVFGDMKEGNGDPSLCLFGQDITPNHHALARQFVLLDNFYCDAEVSADGHNWSMGAYATDYVEKSWPTMYSGRGGDYEYEGGVPIVYPSAGYLWDNCSRHSLTYRSYGEFAENGKTREDSSIALTKSLEGHVAPFYRSWDLDFSDVERFKQWEKEFDAYERNGSLPQIEIIKLPNDHTAGTRSGSPTPKAFVAQNDYALGLIIQRISRSNYWKESAVFVIEDDAQNGPDHVDAHRTVALVISPYTKRGFVDHSLYSTSSMVGTIELILGLPPLSEFDACATPMLNSFTMKPDTGSYTVREPGVSLTEKNIAGTYGQSRSNSMNFTSEDLAPDNELNEIIWRSIKSSSSIMPAPVRSAFVQAHKE